VQVKPRAEVVLLPKLMAQDGYLPVGKVVLIALLGPREAPRRLCRGTSGKQKHYKRPDE